MEKCIPIYSLGDMVVHLSYGVGQIEGVDRKSLNGVEVECFKVKTENAVYWFPTECTDNPRVHPVVSRELVQKAIEILRSTPHDQENDPLQWNERIDKVLKDGDLLAISRIVRDLSALKKNKKLSRTLDQALNNLKGRLLRDWAASLEVDVSSIQPRLRSYLQESSTNSQNAV